MANLTFSTVRFEGNSIYMKATPISGVLALTGFIDYTSGTGVDSTFSKWFRYSYDGINFTDWQNLTVGNITAVPINGHQIIVIELRYDKNQPLGNNTLIVHSANINYSEDDSLEPQQIFENTVFKQFFDTTEPKVLDWYINVLNKLYKRGLLADYIERDKGGSDEDFIQFWSAVCKFFAYYVVLARQFGNFHENELLLYEYLEQKGLKLSPHLTLQDLNYLMEYYHEQFRKRGTIAVAERKRENQVWIDGEILHLLWYSEQTDEFLFNPRLPQQSSWNIGNSSPLYKGLIAHENANKLPNIFTEIDRYENGRVEEKDEDSTQQTVLIENGLAFTATDLIKVDSTFDYQLLMNLKTDGKITVMVEAYDVDLNPIEIYSHKTGEWEAEPLQDAILYLQDRYLPVSLMIYNSERPTFPQNTTSIKQGVDLRMHPQTVWLRVSLSVNSASDHLYCDLFKFFISRTPYSHGLIQTNNIIDLFAVNHNNELNIKEVEQFIVQKLIPYNSHLLMTNMDNATRLIPSDENEDHPINETIWVAKEGYCDTLAWRGINPTCEVVMTRWIPEEETAYCEREIVSTTTTLEPTTTTTTTIPTEMLLATLACNEGASGRITIDSPKKLKLRIVRLSGGPVSYSCQIANSSASGSVLNSQSEKTFIASNILQAGTYSYTFPKVNCKDGTMIVYISLIDEI